MAPLSGAPQANLKFFVYVSTITLQGAKANATMSMHAMCVIPMIMGRKIVLKRVATNRKSERNRSQVAMGGLF